MESFNRPSEIKKVDIFQLDLDNLEVKDFDKIYGDKKLIGFGGFGTVYKVIDKKNQLPLAAKFIEFNVTKDQ